MTERTSPVRPRNPRALPLVAAALLVVPAAGGCGGGTPEAAPATAADGTSVAACADGNCEILVTGPVEIAVGGHGTIAAVSVTEVRPSGLSFTTVTEGGGESSGDLQGGCTLTFHEFGGGSMCVSGGAPPAPEKQTGVLAMQLAGEAEGGVVVRFASGGIGEPPASLRPRIPGFGA
ncbi:hypothetical protein AB0L25_10640 [Spirillospora sp. NPDC052242]